MQAICVSDVVMGVALQGCRRGGNSLTWAGAGRNGRQYATSNSRRTPPPRQPPTTPKPLPFQPPKSAKPGSGPTSKSRSNRDAASSPSPSSSRGSYEDNRQPMSELVRNRWFPLFGAGAAAMCVGLFSVSLLTYWKSHPAEHWIPGQEPATPTGRPSIQSPREFDQHLDKSEWRYGITKLRRRIASEIAHGHVLEVAVGTGRNFDYYDWSIVTEGLEPAKKDEKSSWFNWSGNDEKEDTEKEVKQVKVEKATEEEKKPSSPPTPPHPKPKPESKPPSKNAILSFTGLDISPTMLDLALTRIRQVVPHMETQIPKKPTFAALASAAPGSGEEAIALASNRIRILKADAQAPLPPPPSQPEKYDTVIQTFGLCSVRDPILLLSNMASRVKPETGRIVLLEHGRSFLGLVNGLLDRSARDHFERFGCWWNRDIETIVRAAEHAVPGLEVVRLERPGWVTFGTHVLVEMRVRQGPSAPLPAADSDKKEDVLQSSQSTGGWWPSFLSVNDKPKKD